MSGARNSQSSLALSSLSSNSPVAPPTRTQSGFSFSSSTSSLFSQSSPSATIPRVQLVPHIHRMSYDASLSQSERDILDGTSFDALDLSSKDFDFEDIFTYDKPQKRLNSVVEVSTPSRDKDFNGFSFSHYAPGTQVRQKANKSRNTKGEVYVKNKSEVRKR